MDPNVALIVDALSASVPKLADPIVHDAYNGLKGLIKRKFSHNTTVQEAIDQPAVDSEIWRSVLAKAMVEANVGSDPEIVALAHTLQGQLKLTHGDETTHTGTGDILKDNARKITTQGDYVEGNQTKYVPRSEDG